MSRLTSRLGIELPIVHSGMGGVAGPRLAATVSYAGGLGVLAALRVQPDDLRDRIAQMRERTTRPFGVNIWLHEEMLPPRAPEELDRDAVGRVAAAMVLGADGVLLGTRFVATVESEAHDGWKRAILAGERPTVLADVREIAAEAARLLGRPLA